MKFDFEGTGPAYKSYMGAAVSIIFIVISTIFLYSKFLVLYNVSSVTVTSKLVEGALTDHDVFTHEHGLFIAAALSNYDDV